MSGASVSLLRPILNACCQWWCPVPGVPGRNYTHGNALAWFLSAIFPARVLLAHTRAAEWRVIGSAAGNNASTQTGARARVGVGRWQVQAPNPDSDQWDHVPRSSSTSPYTYDCHHITYDQPPQPPELFDLCVKNRSTAIVVSGASASLPRSILKRVFPTGAEGDNGITKLRNRRGI